jgi:uncharacterized membrane protein YqhA
MLKRVLKLRYIYLIIVVFNLLNSIACLAIGVHKSIKGYKAMIQGFTNEETWTNPGIILVDSLDTFLISLVFLIFAFGVYKIFIRDNTQEMDLPKWLDVKSLIDLKMLLWETFIIILLVFSVSVVIENIHNLSWTLLIIPAIVFLLTVGLAILRFDLKKNGDTQQQN